MTTKKKRRKKTAGEKRFDRLAGEVERQYIKKGVPRETARKWGIETAGKVKKLKDAKAKRRRKARKKR